MKLLLRCLPLPAVPVRSAADPLAYPCSSPRFLSRNDGAGQDSRMRAWRGRHGLQQKGRVKSPACNNRAIDPPGNHFADKEQNRRKRDRGAGPHRTEVRRGPVPKDIQNDHIRQRRGILRLRNGWSGPQSERRSNARRFILTFPAFFHFFRRPQRGRRFFAISPRQMAVTSTARSLLLFLGSGSTSYVTFCPSVRVR